MDYEDKVQEREKHRLVEENEIKKKGVKMTYDEQKKKETEGFRRMQQQIEHRIESDGDKLEIFS